MKIFYAFLFSLAFVPTKASAGVNLVFDYTANFRECEPYEGLRTCRVFMVPGPRRGGALEEKTDAMGGKYFEGLLEDKVEWNNQAIHLRVSYSPANYRN